MKVLALRRDGCNGELELTATHLPAGVTATPGRLGAGQSAGLLFLTASDTAGGAGDIRIVGHARVGAGEVVREAWPATVVRLVADHDQEAVASRLARQPVVAASSVESAPVTLRLAEGKPEAGAGDLRPLPAATQRAACSACSTTGALPWSSARPTSSSLS